jgi:hypothetical protein
MNPELVSDLSAARVRELRQSADQHQRRRRRTSSSRPLRRQLGFTLVEVGLRLLAEPAHTTY